MKTNPSVSDVFTLCLERDNRTCQDCDSKDNLEVHHILPVSQGGTNDLDNLKTVCFDCHRNNYRDVHYPKDKTVLIPQSQRVKQRSGIDKNKQKQVLVPFPNELIERIEKFWHDNKLKNRSEAIRELVKKGLERN